MKLELVRHESLPRLAWLARVERGAESVRVDHGPWVETGDGWFVEGAWAGPFGAAGFDHTLHLAGSGGKAGRDHVLFCAPSNFIERIYSVLVGDSLYVSNSLVFLLHATDDAPDPLFAGYFPRFVESMRSGLNRRKHWYPTKRGREVLVHGHMDVAVSRDLRLSEREKPVAPEPADYKAYVGTLGATIADVMRNAEDPARKHHRYRALVPISRGYDSLMLAALMRPLGATESISFYAGGNPPDHGDTAADLAERLGYHVTTHDRNAYLAMKGMPEAEFSASLKGGDVVLLSCLDRIEGTLLATGRRGDSTLSVDRWLALPNLARPEANHVAGNQMVELRLRIGFLTFFPYFIGAQHAPRLHAISTSPEMRPWWVEGDYNRPIARRAIEEAGLARGTFAMHKAAGATQWVDKPSRMTPESAADFAAFRAAMPRPSWLGRRKWHWLMLARRYNERIDSRLGRLCLKLGVRPSFLVVPREYRIEYDEGDFTFHWGYERIRGRYDLG